MIANLLAGFAAQIVGLFGEWGKAKQDQIRARVSMMERSWTDEVIVVTIFLPLWVIWVDPAAVKEWLVVVDQLPEWYRNMIFAITAAVFGLGKLNGYKRK